MVKFSIHDVNNPVRIERDKLVPQEMDEIDKYLHMYSEESAMVNIFARDYGYYTHGKGSYGLILNNIKPSSIIDCGCGRNLFLKEIKKLNNGIRCVGVDFACKDADVLCSVFDLPFKDNEFDLATSFDMLEHLRPEEIDSALIEICRVSRWFVFSIGYKPSIRHINGKTIDLHPSVFSEDEWIKKISKYTDTVRKYDKYLYGTWNYLK